MHHHVKFTAGTAVLGVLLVASVACSTSAEEDEGPASVSQESPPSETRLQPDEIPLIKGPVSADGSQVIFGTPDLGVGENRVGFVLTSPSGLVRAPAAKVSSFFYPAGGGAPEPKQVALAVFRPWPYGTRGIYTTRLNFDEPGDWRIDIAVSNADGFQRQAELFFEVSETTSAPATGAPAIPSKSKTLGDVERISQLTTGSLHDPALYQTTIADAINSGLPTVIVMASPAFCTNAVCGPQVEVLQELKEAYSGQASFIHVDIYDNPEGIQGDLSRAQLSPTVLEWNLPSTEWSFVIDRDGIVYARFESFATLEELEQALLSIL